ncbi:hypothetical protein B7463_g853, partial [Scytalidium lignicola]
MAEAFLKAAHTFTSDNGYKLIESLVEESMLLKMQLGSKTKETDDLRAEIISLKTRYEDRLQENLEIYRRQRNRLARENVALEKDIITLNTVIYEKDATTTKLNQILDGISTQLDHFGQWLDQEKEKLRITNMSMETLQQLLTDKDMGIESLEQELRNEEIAI